MDTKNIHTATGKTLDQLTIEAVLQDKLNTDDFMISAATLNTQAEAADNAGYIHLARNLRRAAELTSISNEEILEIYDTLRPGRTSYERLITLAHRLETALNAPLTAKLVREAAEAYIRRGIIKSINTEPNR
jgi:propanediol dehydratase small subunit